MKYNRKEKECEMIGKGYEVKARETECEGKKDTKEGQRKEKRSGDEVERGWSDRDRGGMCGGYVGVKRRGGG